MSDENQIERQFTRLGELWNAVHIAYYPEYAEDWGGDNVIVRNQTDEGLPGDVERKEVCASSLSEALARAVERYGGDDE